MLTPKTSGNNQRANVCMYKHIYIYIYIYICVCVCVHGCSALYIHMCTRAITIMKQRIRYAYASEAAMIHTISYKSHVRLNHDSFPYGTIIKCDSLLATHISTLDSRSPSIANMLETYYSLPLTNKNQ